MGQGGPAAHDTEWPPVPTKVPVLSECVCVGMVGVWGGAAGLGRATRARDFGVSRHSTRKRKAYIMQYIMQYMCSTLEIWNVRSIFVVYYVVYTHHIM